MKTDVILVIGAYGGIGTTLCHRLAQQKLPLFLAGRDKGKLAELGQELNYPIGLVEATSSESVQTLFREFKSSGHTLKGVVHLPGSIVLKPVHRLSDQEWEDCLKVNLTSAFYVLREATKEMQTTGGSVVLVSSAAANLGLAAHEAVAAAKAGLQGLALAMAATYASRGIRVNVVAPGLVDTPLAKKITENPLVLKASTAMHPLRRIGRPEDIASAIDWLLNDEQSWVTGQILGVDGGLASLKTA